MLKKFILLCLAILHVCLLHIPHKLSALPSPISALLHLQHIICCALMRMHAGATAIADDEGTSSDEDPAPGRLSQPILVSYLLATCLILHAQGQAAQ